MCLVVIDNFSNNGWTVPFRIKKAQTMKDFFENFIIGSKRKHNLIETDRGTEIYNGISQKFLNNNNISIIL